MASDKKKNYSTEGLNSRQEVQDALEIGRAHV